MGTALLMFAMFGTVTDIYTVMPFSAIISAVAD